MSLGTVPGRHLKITFGSSMTPENQQAWSTLTKTCCFASPGSPEPETQSLGDYMPLPHKLDKSDPNTSPRPPGSTILPRTKANNCQSLKVTERARGMRAYCVCAHKVHDVQGAHTGIQGFLGPMGYWFWDLQILVSNIQ